MPGFHHFQVLNFGLHGMRASKHPLDRSYWNTPQVDNPRITHPLVTHHIISHPYHNTSSNTTPSQTPPLVAPLQHTLSYHPFHNTPSHTTHPPTTPLLPQHKLAMASHPHIVILQFGSNDVAIPEDWNEEAFLVDYVEMIHAFQRLPSKPNVYICIPPPLYESDEGCDDSENQLRRCWFKYMLNTQLPILIRDLVHNDTSLHLIDNFAALGGQGLTRPDAINDDHLHPNDLGYLAMAHEIAYTLSQYENFAPIRPVKKRVGGNPQSELTPL